jgi:uncharacterized SAM-binding protein YcdF (DUF218 family)
MKKSFAQHSIPPQNPREKRPYTSLSSKMVEDILFPKMPIQHSDIAVVFGRGLMTGFLALEAARLYKQGLIKKIIVSGGVPVSASKDTPAYAKAGIMRHIRQASLPAPNVTETEAEWATKILIRQGVHKQAIEVENKSRHTGENVTESIKHHNLANAKRIIIIGEFCHCRRLIETVRHFLPITKPNAPAVTILPVFMPGMGRRNWKYNAALVEGIVKPELQRLGFIPWSNADYVQQKFITAASVAQETAYYKTPPRRKLALNNINKR